MSCTLDDTGGRDVDTMLVAATPLTTTPFEVVRFRLGRRTTAQVRSLTDGARQIPAASRSRILFRCPSTPTCLLPRPGTRSGVSWKQPHCSKPSPAGRSFWMG